MARLIAADFDGSIPERLRLGGTAEEVEAAALATTGLMAATFVTFGLGATRP